MTVFVFASNSWAQKKLEDGRAATVVAMIGKVVHQYVESDGTPKKKLLNLGDAIFQSDLLMTQEGARVKLRFIEGGHNGSNEIVLGPSTSLRIVRASDGKTVPGTELILMEGSLRSNVNRKYTNEGKDIYRVTTPAIAAGVRGTIFHVEHDSKSRTSLVATMRGKVDVGAIGGSGEVLSVQKNMYVSAVQAARGGHSVLGRVNPLSGNKELKEKLDHFRAEQPIEGQQAKAVNRFGFDQVVMGNKDRDGTLSKDARERARVGDGQPGSTLGNIVRDKAPQLFKTPLLAPSADVGVVPPVPPVPSAQKPLPVSGAATIQKTSMSPSLAD